MKLPQRLFSFSQLAAVALVLFPVVATVRGDAAEVPTKSLQYAPADSSFYMSFLRNREQVERLTGSNFWKKANELDYMRQLKALVTLGIYVPDSPLPKILQELEKPENQEAVALLKDMVGGEVFLYGDGRMAKSIALMNEMQSGAQFVKAISVELTGEWSDLTEDERTQRLIFTSLAQDPSRIQTPTMVVGFKTDQRAAAGNQLDRLEKLIRKAIDETDELAILKGRVKREQAAGKEYLTITLAGNMIPWEDEVDWEAIEEEEGQFDEVRKKINDLTLVISLGMHDDYVLLSFSDSLDHLAKLGQGESLAGVDELKPVLAAADQRLTGIMYVSEAMSAEANNTGQMLHSTISEIKRTLENNKQIDELTDIQKKRLAADLEGLSADLNSLLPKPGASVGYSIMTDEGYESFSYDWSENLYYDGSLPLTLWNHVGEKPLLAIVARKQYRPQDYTMVSRWASKSITWFEEIALPQMDESDRKQYERISAIAFPLLTRFDHITKEMAIPSMADSQGGLVIDAELSSKQWWMFAEETEKPLALPLPAALVGVSDTDLFKQALNEYRLLANDTIKAVAAIDGDGVQLQEDEPFEIPLPERQATQQGEVYTYSHLQQAGVDEQLKPTLALSDKPHKIAVFSLAPKQAVRLLEVGSPQAKTGPLSDTKRPMAAASYFDFAGTVDVVVPWVAFGVRSYHANQIMMEQFEQEEPANDDDEEADELEDLDKEIARRSQNTMRQVRETAELLKCFRGATAAITVEDGVTITHSQMRFVDLE